MEPVAASLANHQIVQQTRFKASAGSEFSADLFLRTREGDLVTFSLNNQLSFSQSAQETRLEDGSALTGFSVEARAASQYSLRVQGDLNEEELAAIQKLIEKISPVAQRFFDQSDFDVQEAAEALADSLGTITQVSLSLEKTMTASVSSRSFSRPGATDAVAAPESRLPDLQSPAIRDLGALVESVVQSMFRKEDFEFPDQDSILRSMEDLRKFFVDQLKRFLKPLEERPVAVDGAASGDELGKLANTASPASRFQPVAV